MLQFYLYKIKIIDILYKHFLHHNMCNFYHHFCFFYWYTNSNNPQGNIVSFSLKRFSQAMTSQCMELCVSAGSRCFWIAAVMWRLCWKQTISRSIMSSPPQHWCWKTFRRSLKISGTVTNITPLLVGVFLLSSESGKPV